MHDHLSKIFFRHYNVINNILELFDLSIYHIQKSIPHLIKCIIYYLLHSEHQLDNAQIAYFLTPKMSVLIVIINN